jgi:hypothetical protein
MCHFQRAAYAVDKTLKLEELILFINVREKRWAHGRDSDMSSHRLNIANLVAVSAKIGATDGALSCRCVNCIILIHSSPEANQLCLGLMSRTALLNGLVWVRGIDIHQRPFPSMGKFLHFQISHVHMRIEIVDTALTPMQHIVYGRYARLSI